MGGDWGRKQRSGWEGWGYRDASRAGSSLNPNVSASGWNCSKRSPSRPSHGRGMNPNVSYHGWVKKPVKAKKRRRPDFRLTGGSYFFG